MKDYFLVATTCDTPLEAKSPSISLLLVVLPLAYMFLWKQRNCWLLFTGVLISLLSCPMNFSIYSDAGFQSHDFFVVASVQASYDSCFLKYVKILFNIIVPDEEENAKLDSQTCIPQMIAHFPSVTEDVFSGEGFLLAWSYHAIIISLIIIIFFRLPFNPFSCINSSFLFNLQG